MKDKILKRREKKVHMVKKTRVIKDFLLFRLLTFDFFILIAIFRISIKKKHEEERAKKQTNSQAIFGFCARTNATHRGE